MYKKIFVNQVGYLPNMAKRVTFQSDRPVRYSVHTTDGSCVLSGTADRAFENAAAGETDYTADFSSLTAPGRYYIAAEGLGESDTFLIAENAYDAFLQKSVAFFYLQRCGHDLPVSAAGDFAHPACHTAPARVYGSDERRQVSGGWHDAGDYGRYVGPGAMSAAQLLYACERDPKLLTLYTCPDKTLDSSLPAILEEIKYELDWMMKMQREDGALYHKVSCLSFCSFIMPQEEKEELYISPVSVTTTADFAAVCALAIRFYEKYDVAYAEKLAEVSRKAYRALASLSIPGGFKNPPEISTGEYGDTCDLDERYWAAAELYKAFGDSSYREDFEAIAKEKIYQGYGWADMGSYGNLAYITCPRPVDENLKNQITDAMKSAAEELLSTACADGYGTALTLKQYGWGSNLGAANHGIQLYDAWILTKDERYLSAATDQLSYLCGRNPMGLCYITGLGTDAIKHPHHRPSGFLGHAMEGMLSGGPCDWQADEIAKQLFTDQTPPAKCLADMTGSYSTNEIAIYWNSALVLLAASVLGALD